MLGLSWEACFFLSVRPVGGEADDGPKVKERENDDANAEPKPDPPRAWDW